MTDGVLQIDRLDTSPGAMNEQVLLAERALEVVTELCVLHGAIPPSKGVRYHARDDRE